MEIHAVNVNDAYAMALRRLKYAHTVEKSRNGDVWVFPEPVMTIYQKPWQRVLFSPLRNANPFFHVMEALWMLAGHNDVEWPAYFAKNIANYSDDGKTMHGAYGRRWRSAVGYDQLEVIAQELKKNPETRRAVLQMWDATGFDDLHTAVAGGKDVPCNTHVYFDCRGGVLNMTVLCRSNDLYWGCYGANAVHFSFLQEFMAAWVGVPTGLYRQFSNNLHLYTNVVNPIQIDALAEDAGIYDIYFHGIQRFPLVRYNIMQWQTELGWFMEDPLNSRSTAFTEPFFTGVALPMYRAWWLRKQGQAPEGVTLAAKDWEAACNQWLMRNKRTLTIAK